MSRLTGTIGAHEVTRRESRAEHRLASCWVREAGQARPSSVPGFLVAADDAARVFPRAEHDHAVLVLLGGQSPASLRDYIATAANQGARRYVLADQGSLDGSSAAKLAGRRGAQVLLRRVTELTLSGVLTRRGEASGVFLASADTSPKWWLPVSQLQGAALFRYALHLFWHCATDEGCADNGRVRFQTPRERPFDIPLPSRRAPVRPVDELPRAAPLWFSPSGALPQGGRVDHLFVRPSGKNQAELVKRARAGATIQWTDLGLPVLGLSRDGGAALVGSPGQPLRFELESDQAGAICDLLRECQAAPEWRFHVDVPLADLDGDVLLPGQGAASPVIEDHPATCGAITASSLRSVVDTEPPSRPEAPPLARSVRWSWTVHPPRAPKGARVAPLAEAWKKLDANARARVESAHQQLSDLEDRTGTLGRAFDMLAGALLGFGRTRTNLVRRAGQLAERVPSQLGPADATALLDELNSLEQDLSELVGNVDQAESKARMEKERAEQLAAHDAAKEQARRDLSAHTEELEQQRAVHQEAEKELGSLAGDGHGLSKKDRRARQKKLRDEAKRAERRVARLEQLIADARATVDAEFTFQPTRAPGTRRSGGGGARFVPSERSTPISAAPEEALPAVGELLAHKGSRYLVITRWEDLDQGEAEAERLGAQLVAPAEAT